MAELADAADSKSAEVHPSWGFNSPSRHQNQLQPRGNYESDWGAATFTFANPWEMILLSSQTDDEFKRPYYSHQHHLTGLRNGISHWGAAWFGLISGIGSSQYCFT